MINPRVNKGNALRLISILVAMCWLCSCAPVLRNYDRVVEVFQVTQQPTPAISTQTVSISPVQTYVNPWLSYTNTKDVTRIALDRKGYVWASGPGGVIRWDPANKNYQAFTTSAGLPDNYITALTVSPDDQVWVGTHAGRVAHYDGRAWTAYDPKAGNTISCLAIAPNGLVWIGTDQGPASFDGKNWTTYPTQKIPDHYIHSLAVTSSGEVWAGVLGGIIHYDGKTWNFRLLEKGERISGIVEATDKTLWFASNTALIHFDGSRWSAYRMQDTLQDISSLAIDRQGQVWVADLKSGLARFDEEKLELTQIELPGLTSLAFGAAGELWLGSFPGGIGSFDPGKNSLNTVVAENEPAGNLVLSGSIGTDGSIWIGTDQGASRFDGESWQTYTTADGLLDDNVLAIASSPDGSMLFGTEKGLSIFDGRSWRNIPNSLLVNQGLNNLSVARDGTVWTVNRQSLFQLVGEGWNLTDMPFSSGTDSLRAIAPGAGTGIWLLGTNSLWYFEYQKWISIALPSGAVPISVTQASDQVVWIFAQGLGLIQVNGPLWDQVAAADLQAITLGENGQVEANTNSNGNIPLNGVSWRVYGEADGIPVNNEAFLVANEADGSVWVIAGQAILGPENGKWIDRAGPVKSKVGFTTVFIDPQGSFWISAPLLEGILKFSP